MLDERAYIIIQKILERPFIEKKELIRQNNLTQRQIDYSLDKINGWLHSNSYKPIIFNNHDQLTVDYTTKEMLIKEISERLPGKEYVLNSQERMKYLFFLLFINSDYLSMNHLIDALQVGKTTVMSDLKILTSNLKDYHISLEYNRKNGYHLQGNEMDIRYYILKTIIIDLNEDNNTKVMDYFIHSNSMNNYDSIKSTILYFLKKHTITFVENRLTEFIYSFIFLKERMLKTSGNTVSDYGLASLKTNNEYHFSKDLLQHFNYEVNEDIYYLSAWILGLSMGDLNEENADYNFIMNLVKHIRNRFASFSGIHFENPEEVSKQIYRHFRPVYYRLLFKLPIVNPLCEKIKKEYSELFCLVNESLKPIGDLLERSIPEEEVAYLTMHFASLSTDYKEMKTNQKVALVVCPNGVGSSSITYTVLKSIFPEFQFLIPIETSVIDKVKDHYDVVFSTVPHIRLFSTRKPVYIVSPVMSTEEKYRLIRDVYTEVGNSVFKLPSVDYISHIVEKYAEIKDKNQLKKELYEYFVVNENIPIGKEKSVNLSQITAREFIQLHKSAANWEEAIRLSAEPLLAENKITKQYIEKMVENAKKEGPYMVIMKNVALPHARPIDGVNELSIGITVFKEPVNFDDSSNKPVKYLFCLAAADQEKHLNALSQLMKFLESDKFYAILDNSNTPEEIYEYICKYENE